MIQQKHWSTWHLHTLRTLPRRKNVIEGCHAIKEVPSGVLVVLPRLARLNSNRSYDRMMRV